MSFPEPPTPPEWASYIPRRHPEFKMHKREQDARAALAVRERDAAWYRIREGEMHIYQFVDGEWVLRD